MIDSDGPEVVFQPIVDLSRGTVVGYEALSRFGPWGQARPEEWFKRAAQVGLGPELEAASIRQAFRLAETMPAGRFLALNLSPEALLSDPVHDVFEDQPSLQGVVIELAGNKDAPVTAGLRAVLASARAAGAAIAVDDAGSGYAGLEWILSLDPAMVKLERTMVSGIATDRAKRAWAEMLGRFASRIDAWVVAEGVEHPDDLDALLSVGVPLAQGFALGRPAPGWPECDPEIGHRLGRRTAMLEQGAIGALLEVMPTAPLAEAGFGDGRSVLLVDDNKVAVGYELAGQSPVVPAEGLLRADLADTCSDVLVRAMGRGPNVRWHPIVGIDEAGHAVGIIRIEVLAQAVAALAAPVEHDPRPIERRER